MTEPMAFWVNDRPVQVEVEPGEMLSSVLRYRLGLTGTKIGCDEDECGSCTVHLDGQAVLSCTYPALKAADRRVLTIEDALNGLGVEASILLSLCSGREECCVAILLRESQKCAEVDRRECLHANAEPIDEWSE